MSEDDKTRGVVESVRPSFRNATRIRCLPSRNSSTLGSRSSETVTSSTRNLTLIQPMPVGFHRLLSSENQMQLDAL